jgi:hypothetical protein
MGAAIRLTPEACLTLDTLARLAVFSFVSILTRPAPVNITRRLLLSPAAPAASEDGFVAPVKRKREQPAHLLKFRNRAFGFDTAGHAATVVDASGASEAGHEDKDDVEMEEEEAPAPMAIAIPSSDARKQRERSRTDTDKSKSKKSDESPAKKKKKSKD